ncbi:MAG TPA: FAD:protein FMN transferase, partial [Acidimicrobiia bacterium]|nr:FAD:protein FMN transferase [Acidimicrobiia bacterium]
MGSDAHVIVVGGNPGRADAARRRIDGLEHKWSRFLPDSEISRLTQRAGAWVDLSEDSLLLVQRAVEAWRLTVGRFDPTVLHAVIRAGYDRSFDRLDRDQPGRPGEAEPRPGREALGAAGIEFDGHRVRLPPGLGFDPGGIGKGLAADLVVAEALHAGATGVCVNLGGDLRVAGEPPSGDSWTVAVDHPLAG